jgi:hypothetical protein
MLKQNKTKHVTAYNLWPEEFTKEQNSELTIFLEPFHSVSIISHRGIEVLHKSLVGTGKMPIFILVNHDGCYRHWSWKPKQRS